MNSHIVVLVFLLCTNLKQVLNNFTCSIECVAVYIGLVFLWAIGLAITWRKQNTHIAESCLHGLFVEKGSQNFTCSIISYQGTFWKEVIYLAIITKQLQYSTNHPQLKQ